MDQQNLTVLKFIFDGAKVTVEGCGDDYVMLVLWDDCPDCISHTNGFDQLAKLIGQNGGVVVVSLKGACISGLHDNILYMDDLSAKQIFPEIRPDWWQTQRRKSTAPATFAEVCEAYKQNKK